MSAAPSGQPPPSEQNNTNRASPEASSDTEGAREPGRTGPSHGGEPAPSEDFEDRWRRTLADLDNVRKRHVRDVDRERAAERARVAAAFLPVLDTIDMALEHADADPATIVAGVRAVREQALDILTRLGYPRQDDVGVPFDPVRHEVVAVVSPEASGQPAGSVTAVLRPGYGEPASQLRPAAVTVADRPGS
jgi:molecular chaperone GrpE